MLLGKLETFVSTGLSAWYKGEGGILNILPFTGDKSHIRWSSAFPSVLQVSRTVLPNLTRSNLEETLGRRALWHLLGTLTPPQAA